jgi:hypothetical protein
LVLVQIAPIPVEGGVVIERNLELRVGQFFRNGKHVPPSLLFIVCHEHTFSNGGVELCER